VRTRIFFAASPDEKEEACAAMRTSFRIPKCSCGGILKPVTLRNYDFSQHAGIPVFLDEAPGLKCSACRCEALIGEVVNVALFLIALMITRVPHRLLPEMTKYLRRYMLTQQELADRMGAARETVGSWEVGLKEISAQNDFILRVLVINHAQSFKTSTLTRAAMAGLSAVKSSPPPPHPPNLRVTKEDFKKFPSVAHMG
jgi:DNA-binding XRE family transcriptional regulator